MLVTPTARPGGQRGEVHTRAPSERGLQMSARASISASATIRRGVRSVVARTDANDLCLGKFLRHRDAPGGRHSASCWLRGMGK